MGFQALVSQVILLRETLFVVSGHEIAIGLMMGSWLLGVFAGALAGARIPVGGRKQPGRWLCALLLGSISVSILVILGLRQVRAFLGIPPGLPLSALLSAMVIWTSFATTGAVVGAMFPLAASVERGEKGVTSRPIAKVYLWEAIGSLLGGTVLTFVLIPRLSSLEILFVCGFISSSMGSLGLLGPSKRASCVMGFGALFFFIALLCGAASSLHEWSVEGRWKAMQPTLWRVASVDSPYQSLELGKLEDQFTLFGNGRPICTFPDPFGAAPLAYLLMGQRPKPDSVLLLGGIPGSLMPLLLESGVGRLEAAELDGAILELTRPYLPEDIRTSVQDPRVRIITGDARSFLKSIPPGSVDAVVVQMPDPATTLLSRFHTKEFFLSLRTVLRPPGFVIHSVTGSSTYLGNELEEFLGTIYWTMRHVFEEVRVIPGERTLFLASTKPGPLILDPEALASRFREEGREDIPAGLLAMWIQPGQVEAFEKSLIGTKAGINRDEHPISTVRFLSLWERLSGASFGARVLRWLEGMPWWIVLLIVTALSSLVLWDKKGFNLDRSVLLALSITGANAMVQEIACLYLYQTVWGQLYSKVGIIVGTFMAGLAMGAWLGAWGLAASTRRQFWTLFWTLGAMCLLCFSITLLWVPLLLEGESPKAGGTLEAALWLWMFVCGIATGATFPVVCSTVARKGMEVQRVAGLASAWDHCGAALGALIGGTGLIPALGISSTGAVVGGLQAISIIYVGLFILASRKGPG